MDMQPMPKNLPYLIMFTTTIDEVPHVHGYANEEDRDAVYEQFIQTGKIKLRDDNLGVEQEFEPAYVARMNLIDGTINYTKVREIFSE